MKKSFDIVSRCGMVDTSSIHAKGFYMSTDKPTTAELRSQYVKSNRHRFAHYAASQRDKLKLEMVEAYGGKCLHCGESDPVVLSLDHINDDAHIEKELYGDNARGGHKHYGRLKAQGWPKDRFQLLCFNCNAKKEHNRRRLLIGGRWGEAENADRHLVQARIGKTKQNTSGFKGVFWNGQKRKWTATIMIDYKQRHLGFYFDIKDAARAYRKAAIEAWGENANVPSLEEIDSFVHEETVSTMQIEDLGL